jgi:hypothetical protein
LNEVKQPWKLRIFWNVHSMQEENQISKTNRSLSKR